VKSGWQLPGSRLLPNRFATISPVLPSACSTPTPKRSASFSGGPTDLPAAPAEVALIVPMRSGRRKADHQKDARQRAAADALAVVDADLN